MKRPVLGVGLVALGLLGLPPTASGQRRSSGLEGLTGHAILQSRLERLQGQQRSLDAKLTARGREYVRLVRLGLLPISAGFDGFVQHAQRAELMRRSLAKDVAKRQELTRKTAALSELLAGWGSNEHLDSTRSDRSEQALLAAKEREAAFQRAFGEVATSSGHAAVFGSFESVAEVERFADLRGRLSFPVEGRARVSDWAPDGHGPGLRFIVAADSIPRAVFAGKVVMVGDFGELGRAVVIEHGGGYSTVTANLAEVIVEAGQSIRAGSGLGRLRPGAEEPAIYFEVRHQGFAIEPADWFGL